MAKTDRSFKLKIVDNELPLASTGMVDTRLFKGGNIFHIKKDPETNFWTFAYDDGIIPQPLRCNFTNFTMAKKHADLYYNGRNLNLEEIDP